MDLFLAMALKPLLFSVLFAVVVAPLTWFLWRLIPDGRFKIALFRVRSGEVATGRDKTLMAGGVVLGYLVLGSLIWWLSRQL